MRIFLRTQDRAMTAPETDRSRIIARLPKEGWTFGSGAKHDKFAHPDRPGIKIMVPRHKTLSPGVARNIAKAAGW
jgi:predicted RNA binding protein YcfA (HicA-like mRNA interferase family)